jgi:hypothetical protein
MTGRWGAVVGGIHPGGRWNGDVPEEADGALVGERDRLVGEMWSWAMARWRQYRSRLMRRVIFEIAGCKDTIRFI